MNKNPPSEAQYALRMPREKFRWLKQTALDQSRPIRSILLELLDNYEKKLRK